MKKKLLAAIAAGAMLCGMLTAPVSAAETYQKGDVNMDGVVDVTDAQLILMDYTQVMSLMDGILTSEQREIGNVDEKTETKDYVCIASVEDANWVLRYYCSHLVNSEITLEDVLGKKNVIDEALKTFFESHQIVFDEQSGRYITVEKGN